MNSKVVLIQSKNLSDEMLNHIDAAFENRLYEHYIENMPLQNRKILFVVELNPIGYDLELLSQLTQWSKNKEMFLGSTGAIIVRSHSELYTKSFAQDIILHCNQMGLGFIGHSVVEIVHEYKNFSTWQQIHDVSLSEICDMHCSQLIERLLAEEVHQCDEILALHSSSYKTSNTLGLWHMVKSKLEKMGKSTNEIHIENGTVVDCKGCPFQTCMYYGESRSCFYGGIMVEEVLPSIEKADVIVWVCPNYNDAISANLLAVINRLTVLYRQISFHNKLFYAIIVSGNSGSDSVAKQLIGALNINKGFYLPPYFTMMEIANAPMKVLEIEGVEERASITAKRINNFCQ